ncbi:PfkB domain protein [Kribbella flavida DSM 17836]|uniref:PfkB domain protein n=1 Tax=Kribbella flavida (strain DSM 17836 / JCM 10339 / NBRC 14399) TaxID=479435 RepID=D2PVL5_KRIFD|nr:PfkB family carbohydrate kinase [Kribbella flavida]ADB35255.1 PfkB domain protein [Kribbella flavida DSM 17836]
MRLLHLGNVVVDLVLTVDALPVRGGDVLASSTTHAVGGGFNVMAAAARLGLPTQYCGVLGTGPFADQARAALRAEGIESSGPVRPDLDTGFVVALVEPSGERTFVTSPGAEATLTPDALPETTPDDLVYLSGYSLLHPTNRATVVPWLAHTPATVFFDPGPLVADIPRAALNTALTRTNWLSCNLPEARALATHQDPHDAAETLLHDLPTGAGVLVRLGAGGCLVGERGRPVRLVDGFAVEAVDLNGAGDAHAGAFLAGLAYGKDALEAAWWANAAAALAVTRRGPATGPTRAELESFLRGRERPPRE